MFAKWIGSWVLCAYATGAAALDVPRSVSSDQANFVVRGIASGLKQPWSLAFLPGGAMLVAERNGTIKHIAGEVQTPLTGVPAALQSGQGGYFDVVLHPRFAETQWIYFAYAAGTNDANGTVVTRAKLTGTALSELKTIFEAAPKKQRALHFGGRLVFLKDGTLVISLGEGARYQAEAQNLMSDLGKIVRVKDDGTVPADNPFVGRADARPEIWSYGHRNVQGLALRPGTDQLWANEHGPRGGDELNLIAKGANYGWPVITYGINYDGTIITKETARAGMEQPVVTWVPSIAPSSLMFYAGDKFPQWKGDAFVPALAGQHLRRLEFQGDKVSEQEVLLSDQGERLRDAVEGPDGLIYLLTDNEQGRILRLEPQP